MPRPIIPLEFYRIPMGAYRALAIPPALPTEVHMNRAFLRDGPWLACPLHCPVSATGWSPVNAGAPGDVLNGVAKLGRDRIGIGGSGPSALRYAKSRGISYDPAPLLLMAMPRFRVSPYQTRASFGGSSHIRSKARRRASTGVIQ